MFGDFIKKENNNNISLDTEREAESKNLTLPKKLYIKLLEYAQNNLNNMLSQTGKCIWYHANYKSPYFDNLCFLYGNTVFSVLIEVIDENNTSYLRQKHIDRQLAVAEQYNFIPCKYSVVVPNPYDLNNVRIKALNNGLNLVHTQTNEKIVPKNIATNEKVLMSDWEIRHFSILFTAANLKSQGCKIARLQDTMEVDPQIWFYTPDGISSWAIVRFSTPDKKEELDEDKLNQILSHGFKNNGFIAEVQVNPEEGTKLYRNTNPNAQITSFRSIHSLKDFETKSKGDIFKEDCKELVLSSVAHKKISLGSLCEIYSIPNYPGYLLKIGTTHVRSINEFPDNYKFVKIRYSKSVEDNEYFGLPVYAMLPEDSPITKRGYITPLEIKNDRDKQLIILRKIPGEPVGAQYRHFFLDIAGEGDIYAFKEQSKNLMEIYAKYGEECTRSVLNRMAQGLLSLKKDELGPGSKPYKFVEPKIYETGYRIFLIHYFDTLKQLAALPQEAYNQAVENILLPVDLTFDFNHPKNTLIDYSKNKFYFIDFEYRKEIIEAAKKENSIEKFRDILLGKNIHLSIQPKDMLFNAPNINTYNKLAKIITLKLNNAAPNNLKLTTNSY